MRAIPLKTTDPNTKTPLVPGGACWRSSISPALAMASAIVSATITRSEPNTSSAMLCKVSREAARDPGIGVTTTSPRTGSIIPKTVSMSLSAMAEYIPTVCSHRRSSATACAKACTAPGLCPASATIIGEECSTSRRPGEDTSAKACATDSPSSACPPSWASTAVKAIAAFWA